MKIHIIKKGWLRQKYHFVIKAKNGRILASSEKYHNYTDCLDSAKLFQLPIEVEFLSF